MGTKRLAIIVVLFCCLVPSCFGIGAGLSYYFPFGGEGGLGLGLGMGLGFGKYFLLEGRLSYFQFDGLKTDHDWATQGWFKTKTLLADGLLKIQMPTKYITPYIMGGPALFWNFQIVPYEGRIDRDLRRDRGAEVLNSEFTHEGNLGLAWSAGGGFKLTPSKKLSVDIGARYYRCRPQLDMQGTYKDESTDNKKYPKKGQDDGSRLIMDGILVLLGFSL